MLHVTPLLHLFFRGQVIFFLEAEIRGRTAAADRERAMTEKIQSMQRALAAVTEKEEQFQSTQRALAAKEEQFQSMQRALAELEEQRGAALAYGVALFSFICCALSFRVSLHDLAISAGILPGIKRNYGEDRRHWRFLMWILTCLKMQLAQRKLIPQLGLPKKKLLVLGEALESLRRSDLEKQALLEETD